MLLSNNQTPMKKIILATLFQILFFSFFSVAQTRIETDLSGKGWKLWKDNDSTWKNDRVYLPPVNIKMLPVNIPSGGWNALKAKDAIDVSLPGTAEEYLQKISGPEGDIKGVSWWYRSVKMPAYSQPRKVFLRFESARYRSEVFINQKLAGYDLIGNTPFEVDITNFAKPGETLQLAVRITDPGGNFDWGDGTNIKWGKVNVTGSHGFGGITGKVKLIICDPVYIDDIYVQNTPVFSAVNLEVTTNNTQSEKVKRDLVIRVTERKNTEVEVFRNVIKAVTLTPGVNTIPVKVSVPKAKLWNVDSPNLYIIEVSLTEKDKISDTDSKTFGFRWFDITGIGTNAMFKLNGKRIVLRTAISWGFWPENGIFPTADLAEKQILTAKQLGLNMLSFHRCIGQNIVMDKADELGLLYYEEPGNYISGNSDSFSRACLREKLLRMVRRDRSRACLIIYNMQNEMRDVPDSIFALHKKDMRDAHKIDPSRVITRTSGWALKYDAEDQAKLHMRPFDTTQYMNGWFDYHRAPGPHTWMQQFYRSPTDYYNNTNNKAEIVYWGEEGALSAPPRIVKIKEVLDKQPNLGWDGALYREQYNEFMDFYKTKKLSPNFSSLDALTMAMGKISFEHQGRKIESIRINNVSDGYAVNGWESEILENHSGVVDCYRNPKADPAIMAYYNQPLYVAIKTRQQVVKASESLLTDFYIVNEKDVRGPHILSILVNDTLGKELFRKDIPVKVTGGEIYGQLIADGIAIPSGSTGGLCRITASLKNVSGKVVASGHESFLTVNTESQKISGKGSVWENGAIVKNWLKKEKGFNAPTYTDSLSKLDWVVVTRSPKGGDKTIVPNEQLLDLTGNKGLTTSYYIGGNFETKVAEQTEPYINMVINQGATPHPKVTTTENYSIRWEGSILPPYTGKYDFEIEVGYGGTADLTINGQTFSYNLKTKTLKGALNLEAGKAVALKIDLRHKRYTGACRLFWSIPDLSKVDPQKLIDRVKKEGTSLVIIDNAVSWMELISRNTPTVKYTGNFVVGSTWLGGVHFVKQHPLFKDLPVNQELSWPYEMVVKNGNERVGIEMEGEELVAGAYHSFPLKLGTAVGIIPCGKGKIIFSTLDIYNSLMEKESTAEVARKLLLNYIDFASAK